MTAVDLVAHVDDSWPVPMTPDDRIEWAHALDGLDEDYAIATIGTLQRTYPGQRPSTATFSAAYRGVKSSAERPERAPRRTGKQWADEIRAANPSIPTHLRSEP